MRRDKLIALVKAEPWKARARILAVLRRYCYLTDAARHLRINRNTLSKWCDKLGIDHSGGVLIEL